MSDRLSHDENAAQLLAFIRERFLAGDPEGELDEDTPLLAYGVLNSLNTAVLLAHINETFHLSVSSDKVDADTFRSVRSISALLSDTAAGQPD